MPGQTDVAAGGGGGGGPDGAATRPADPAGPAAAPGDRIAAAALAELPREGSILLDAGPLSERLARSLPPACGLNVITNSMSVAMHLMTREDVTVLLIGGRIHADAGATVGGPGATGLEGLRVDVAFITPDGISPQRGLTARVPVESAAKRMMVQAAGRVVVLAPRTVVGYVGLARFAALADVDRLITDASCDTPAGRRIMVGVQDATRV
ncbi:DeoR/GlpR family DNA-binding transcription regulator [Streptomonospora wellingtoniae]|uniref:DeoR family transcriptional regulator n=1 Tax=Streptomonospora wellingtoniae TaxID=3075544 RepID=A0ABU2L135_9ACTN|nr:DeoR family transcriptional regulator [Streptomonospora sp. DSM 45055]MDT0305274.1 DeoR family transcriptional regulator [Streptomonospora sp. DSM 45055]